MKQRFTECVVGGPDTPEQVLASLTDAELDGFTVDLKRHLDAGHAWLVEAVAELDRRQVAETRHVLTTRQWVTRFIRVPKTAAARLVKAARNLHSIPNVHKRALEGEIAPETVTMLSAAAAKYPADFSLHEETFADIGSYLDPSEVRKAVRYWEQQVDHPTALADAHHRRDLRRFGIHQTTDGMWHTQGLLDPETGHLVTTALRAHTDPANLDTDDPRSYPQRMADALGDICGFWLTHNDSISTSGGEKPHLTITIDYGTLIGATDTLPELDGRPITPDTMRRLACDAGIVRIITDAESQPLDISRRTRTITPAIRRALDHRDAGCTWDGCDAPASWCDAHHIQHWADGGPTTLGNLTLLCRKHHTATHQGKQPTRGSPEPPDR